MISREPDEKAPVNFADLISLVRSARGSSAVRRRKRPYTYDAGNSSVSKYTEKAA